MHKRPNGLWERFRAGCGTGHSVQWGDLGPQGGPTVPGSGSSATFTYVSLVETVLVFVAIPGGIYGVVALLTLRVRASKTPRYRPGQDWDYPPVWWTANPEGAQPVPVGAGDVAGDTVAEDSASSTRTAWGGARGSW